MDHKYLSYTGLKRFFYAKILKQINLKIDKTNGDISNTKVRSVDTISTEFPDPVAGESTKTFLGKVKKCLADWKAIKSTLLTLSMLTNQYENSTSKIPTSALVYALKQNADELNSNLTTVDNKLNNKMDSSRIRTAAGVFNDTSITQTFNISGSSDGNTYLLAAQIQLYTGVWSDLRTLDGIMRIDYTAPLVNVIKSSAEIYAGYFVRFVFLD